MMEALGHVVSGFAVAVSPVNLLYVFLGVLIGTFTGVLPGLGPAAAIALLIPVTYNMDSVSALIMLAGIYYGAMYGGSTTSILIKTPGEPASVVTCLDGYAMAQKGRAGAALAIAALGSFIAGTIAIVLLSFFAIPLASFALMFGPAEYFALMLFSLSAVSALAGRSPAKGLIATILGLMIGTIGIDLQTGMSRFTFGTLELQTGLDFLVVVIGLFAITEVFTSIEDTESGNAPVIRLSGRIWLTMQEWRRSVAPIIRGSFLGFILGVLPGTGATISSMFSYVMERRLTKNPGEFGKGAIEGVAGPESANNAAATGALVPLLTLGIPGSGTTAVMLSAFVMYGIQPGPLLFKNDPALVWGLVDSMYVGNVMLLVLNLPLVGWFAKLLEAPRGLLLSGILGLSFVGLYSVNSSILDLYLALGLGVVGYAFTKCGLPAAPLIMGMVLGPTMEQSFRQAMTLSSGNPRILISSPISATFVVAAIASISLPVILPRVRRWVTQAT
jgi:putative tricarboxylic transport membrane protein